MKQKLIRCYHVCIIHSSTLNTFLKEFTLAKIEAAIHLRNFLLLSRMLKITFCSRHFPAASFAIIDHFDAICH